MLTLEPLGGDGSAGDNGANGSQPTANTGMLSVEQCVAAVLECDVPVVSISGREPLKYPDIAPLTHAVLKLGKHLFLSTDGELLRQRLHMIPPYKNFFWNVKLDGTERVHDDRNERAGLFREALDGIKAAKNAGFFVVVTSTIYPDTDVSDLEALYARVHEFHVDGYAFSPHYPTEKLCRDGSARFHEKMRRRFREVSERLADYNLMISPIYLEYLRGERELDCSVWGSPVYGPNGWSGPCYLQNVNFAQSYKALLEETVWENYGRGLNPRCENCQCREGFETGAILGMNRKAGDVWKTLAWQFQGSVGARREGKRQT
jgi:hopanoid biosynthesis associated radical SAM protein HpnH